MSTSSVVLILLPFILLFMQSFFSKTTVNIQNNDETNTTNFIPTREWKTVFPGQKIPPGLHVQHNFETGVTQAKLIDNDSIDNHGENTNTSHIKLINSEHEISLPSDERKLKHLFRSTEKLKRHYERHEAKFKNEIETLKKIVFKLSHTNSTTEETLTLLEDLTDLLHQIDNAKIFADDNGFTVLIPYLHSSSVPVQRATLRAIAAAVQGNSKVQLIALHQNILENLHKIIKSNLANENLAEKRNIISSCLFTLGSLLRAFPAAQKHFFSHVLGLLPTGFDLLAQVANLDKISPLANRTIRARVLSLLSDLYTERKTAKRDAETNPTLATNSLWNLYASIPFEEEFIVSGWCDIAQDILMNDMQSGLKSIDVNQHVDHDRREKIITSALNFIDLCDQWKFYEPSTLNNLIGHVQSIEGEYVLRANNEDIGDYSYFTQMLDKVRKLILLLHKTAKIVPKEEL